MSILESLILGIVQGLTEFLPISSSAHLVITEGIFHLHPSQMILFDLTVHLGTLMAVIVYFRTFIKELIMGLVKWKNNEDAKANRKLLAFLLLATMVSAAIGVPVKDSIIKLFDNIRFVAIFLIMNGVILLMTKAKANFKTNTLKEMCWWQAVMIGVFQAFGLLPGISRSGITIAAGIFAGIHAGVAAQFSFLLAVFAIGGAYIIEMTHQLGQIDFAIGLRHIIGFFTAFIVGLFAIKILFGVIRRHVISPDNF